MSPFPIAAAARAWMDEDPDPETRAQIAAMLDDDDTLAEHFEGSLSFGTAGIRGALGPGPMRMNRALVRRVAAAIGGHLLDTVGSGVVVIGLDARRKSRAFAADSARVLASMGFSVRLYADVCPTPELAAAVVHHGAVAGIMVTASHNPPQDNGYKVYGADGAQILPEMADAIARRMDAITSLRDVAVPPLDTLGARVRPPDPAAAASWLSGVAALRVHRDPGPLRIVYTPMHGVGWARIREVLTAAGHADVHVVPEQAEPDGSFPTVSFPNPEEPGALDLAYGLATRLGADLVLANDPDADRLAVAVPDAGGFRRLTGNEMGVLLADDLLTHGPTDRPRMVATTVVSTALLSKIAASHGVAYTETLTGFKWIAAEALRFDASGGRFVLGFEEAIGYSAGSVVRDKDGVSAALLVADLAAWLRTRGRTLLDGLDDLAHRHGAHASAQRSIRLPGAAGRQAIDNALTGLRARPPVQLAGVPIQRHRDLRTGVSVDRDSGQVTRLQTPPSNVLGYDLRDGSRLLVRPSGTEPKLKFYAEAVTHATAAGIEAAFLQSAQAAERLLDAILEETGL